MRKLFIIFGIIALLAAGFFALNSYIYNEKQGEDILPEPITGGECYIGGCSGQLCSDEPGMVSTCEYREEYACYKTATCERQSNGQCGWTKTAEFSLCLEGKPVAENPEGEADPSRMTLQMKKWIWQTDNKFTLTFSNDGKFSASTDCNSVGGSYTANGNVISFSQIFSTKMYCEGSKESDFSSMLQDAQSYRFTSRGEFILTLKSGEKVVFR
jgi:heat shock protein HslJ